MENEFKIKGKDFVPITGAMSAIDRYVNGVKNTNNIGEYIIKGTAEIIGLAFYNTAVIIATLNSLEKLIK